MKNEITMLYYTKYAANVFRKSRAISAYENEVDVLIMQRRRQ